MPGANGFNSAARALTSAPDDTLTSVTMCWVSNSAPVRSSTRAADSGVSVLYDSGPASRPGATVVGFHAIFQYSPDSAAVPVVLYVHWLLPSWNFHVVFNANVAPLSLRSIEPTSTCTSLPRLSNSLPRVSDAFAGSLVAAAAADKSSLLSASANACTVAFNRSSASEQPDNRSTAATNTATSEREVIARVCNDFRSGFTLDEATRAPAGSPAAARTPASRWPSSPAAPRHSRSRPAARAHRAPGSRVPTRRM